MKWLWFLLLPLPLFAPYLWLDHPTYWSSPDSIFYLNLYTSYRDALWQGEFYPRWIQESNMGLGTVAFYTFTPLVYHITALISAPFPQSDMQQFLFGMYGSQTFGAWAIYRWLRRRYDARLSMLGAVLYTLMPYKLMVIYQHYNLAQCWAMAFAPLWLHAAEHVGTRKGIFAYALAAALCFYAHPLTFLVIGPLALAYALSSLNSVWRLIAAHLLGFFLITPQLAAMFISRPWIAWERWVIPYYNSLVNLHHSDDYYCLYIPVTVWIFYRCRKRLSPQLPQFWALAALAYYIFATPLSYPLWANISALNLFQFPFARTQPAMALALSVVCVQIGSTRSREFMCPVAGLFILCALLIEFHLQLVYAYPSSPTMPPTAQQLAIQHHMTTSFSPKQISLPVWTKLSVPELIARHQEFEIMPRVSGNASIDHIQEGNDWLSFHATADSDTTLHIARFYIPAWTSEPPLEIRPGAMGLIDITLPKGEHDIRIALRKSWAERVSDILALATLALCVPGLLLPRAYAFNKT